MAAACWATAGTSGTGRATTPALIVDDPAGVAGAEEIRHGQDVLPGVGLVAAGPEDGTEKPAMQEVRYWYASPEARAARDEANRRAAASVPRPGPPR